MDRISDISKIVVKNTVAKSITKKRTTFWQMVRCMAKFEYKPSWLLIITTIGAVTYIISPLSMLSEEHIAIRFLDDLFILFVLLKVLSHETLRYTRYKARNRRFCD